MSEQNLNEHFIDWHQSTFGMGYGTGELHTIPALKKLIEACPSSGCYDYRDLENSVGPACAWLLIDVLCKASIFEYGTSPRHGWLSDQGRHLQAFIRDNTAEQLVNIVVCCRSDHSFNYPDYENEPRGKNPFWPPR